MAVHAESKIQLNTIPVNTSLLGGHFLYKPSSSQSGLTQPSANVIENAAVPSNPAQWGYNTNIGANGIKLRYNEITLSEWNNLGLTFYVPGTNNPSLQLTSGINTALNIYNPTNNVKTLGLDVSGLNFYGTNNVSPDVTLNADGLTLINGSIRGGTVGQDEFLYLSPQVFSDEYEEYILSEDTEVDETKVYYIRSGEAGEYVYTEVSEPTGNPQENEYYEIAHAPGTIPIDDYVKNNWRQIIGRKFAVDTDGNLYANGLNANNANIEGAITATSLTIGSGSSAYDGAAAINISGYDIEIEKNGIDEVENVSVYLYPILYHNGIQVPVAEVDYSNFVWYQDDDTIGTEGDENNSGRYLATYGHNYRVIYDFDDGAVGGGTEIQTRTVDPSKYITKTGDESITIHPEYWENRSSYISLNIDGLNIFNRYGNSIAQYGSTARIGLDNSSRFLINSNSLEAYDSNNNKYFEVNSNGLSWGNNTAATTNDLVNAAKTATNYITTVNSGGISIHDENDSTGRNILINSNNISIRNDEIPLMILDDDSLEFNVLENETPAAIASFGKNTRLGREEFGYAKLHLSSDELLFLSADSTEIFNTGVASEEHSTSRIHIDADWNSSQTVGLVLSSYTIARNETVTAYGAYYSSTVHNIPSGTTFTLEIQMHNAAASWGTAIFKNNFVKGTEATLTNDLPQNYFNTSMYYDGDASFTLSGTITNTSFVTWNIIDDKGIFTGQTEVLESVVYNTSIGGNAFINESNGGIYLCLPQKNEYRSSDRKLYNIINTLGWNDEVFAGIKLAEHTKTISLSDMIIDDIIELSFLPLTATGIEVESSDTSVIDGGYIYFDDDDDYRIYFVALEVEGNGTCTVTVKMTFAGEVYSDSCEVTVTGGSEGDSGVETPIPIE